MALEIGEITVPDFPDPLATGREVTPAGDGRTTTQTWKGDEHVTN